MCCGTLWTSAHVLIDFNFTVMIVVWLGLPVLKLGQSSVTWWGGDGPHCHSYWAAPLPLTAAVCEACSFKGNLGHRTTLRQCANLWHCTNQEYCTNPWPWSISADKAVLHMSVGRRCVLYLSKMQSLCKFSSACHRIKYWVVLTISVDTYAKCWVVLTMSVDTYAKSVA